MRGGPTIRRYGRRIRAGLGLWPFLLVVSLGTVGAMDALLLELTTSYFTSGYNSAYVGGVAERVAYVGASAMLDAALICGMWALLLPVASTLRVSRIQVYALAAMAAVAVPLVMNVVRHNLYATLGTRISLSLLTDASEGDSGAVLAELVQEIPATGVLLAIVVALGVVGILLAARWAEPRIADVEGSFGPPRSVTLASGFVLLALIGILVLAIPLESTANLRFGLSKKPAAMLLSRVVQWVSDVDGDGSGLMSQPPDPAPFDGSIRPFALDHPDNGVDENGVGGDHPARFDPVSVVPQQAGSGRSRPHFLLILLESFRADLIGYHLGDREVTPFLTRLAREGSQSERSFVHSPFTIASRAQLFGGRLVNRPGQSTLIDDFKSRGYTVAHYSGQDESFGNSEALLGVERADFFYDARQDVDRRTSASTNPAGLQISWQVLLERVFAFLDVADPAEPLFLYVNVVDTHHPYHHAQLENILGIEPIARREIGPDRREQVWATYANNVANVDRAVQQLFERWQGWVAGRDHGVLLTADHGQAFYERQFLGHGQSLDEKQTRVPFVLWRVGGEWPEPLGLADVRGLLSRNLFDRDEEARPRARFVPDPERLIVQFVPYIEAPRWIGLRSIDRLAAYDLRFSRLSVLDENDQPVTVSDVEKEMLLNTVVWNWEEIQLRSAETNAELAR